MNDEHQEISVTDGDLSVTIRTDRIILSQDGQKIAFSWQRFARLARAVQAVETAHSAIYRVNKLGVE